MKNLVLSFLILLGVTSTCSQILSLRLYTQNHGLASNVIMALAQDSQGFLWIGTNNGLSRFDGSSFVSFSTPDGLPSDYITAVHETRRAPGTLVVGTMLGGLARFQHGSAAAVPLDRHAPPRTITHIVEDSSGVLWIAT